MALRLRPPPTCRIQATLAHLEVARPRGMYSTAAWLWLATTLRITKPTVCRLRRAAPPVIPREDFTTPSAQRDCNKTTPTRLAVRYFPLLPSFHFFDVNRCYPKTPLSWLGPGAAFPAGCVVQSCPAAAFISLNCGSGATRALKRWPRRSAAEEKPEGGGTQETGAATRKRASETVAEARSLKKEDRTGWPKLLGEHRSSH